MFEGRAKSKNNVASMVDIKPADQSGFGRTVSIPSFLTTYSTKNEFSRFSELITDKSKRHEYETSELYRSKHRAPKLSNIIVSSNAWISSKDYNPRSTFLSNQKVFNILSNAESQKSFNEEPSSFLNSSDLEQNTDTLFKRGSSIKFLQDYRNQTIGAFSKEVKNSQQEKEKIRAFRGKRSVTKGTLNIPLPSPIEIALRERKMMRHYYPNKFTK